MLRTPVIAVGLGLALASPLAAQAPAAKPAAAPAAKPAAAAAPAKPAAKPKSPVKPAAPKAAPETLEPEALAALRSMSVYLATLPAMELTSNTSLDIVTNQGQTIQIDGVVKYKVRRPDGFVIDLQTAGKKRRYYYDGKNFTMQSPELGFYATADAPPTIRQTLDTLSDRFGIQLPLEDLFRWNDTADDPAKNLVSGFTVGDALIDGQTATQYAFRQANVDWQIWIKKGAQPLPLKVAIVDKTDPAHPGYVARLSWNLNPQIAASDFTFKPTSEAMLIRMSDLSK